MKLPVPFTARVTDSARADLQVAMVSTNPPLAVPTSILASGPLNLGGGSARLLLVRDPRTGVTRAFERRASGDLFPTFAYRDDLRHHPDALLIDSDSESIWTSDGLALDGPLKGEQLTVSGDKPCRMAGIAWANTKLAPP